MLLIFIGLFIISEIAKFVRGDGYWGIIDIVLAVVLASACAATRHFTSSNIQQPERTARGRLLPLQLLACAFVFIATELSGMHKAVPAVPAWLHVDLWDKADRFIYELAAQHMSATFALGVSNLSMYCIPAALLLLALGVPLSQQGLGRFTRGSAASAVVLLIVPIIMYAYAVASGRAPVGTIVVTWLWTLLQAGFSEEFLWRGIIFGRLRAIMKAEYALFLQAALFASWHAAVDIHGYHGNIVDAVFDMIASQAMFGLAAGYITLRTGNVALSSAFHTLFDSLSIFQ
ncbi:MAG TPA: CPBP family intramembrane glutamic endopeptidase [Candidatus Dormibacteraeota bacterium]|nr:CPBP family intramembrane glutamic endopeptidase [Candidatus Dormibacteraeota bacterium]